MAGATFSDVGVSLFVAGAAFGEIWVDSRTAKCFIFSQKCVSKRRKETSATGQVRDVQFMLGFMALHPFSAHFLHILERHFSWQVQYLLTLEGDASCSAQCTWRFICDRINHESHLSWRVQYLLCWRVAPVAPLIVNDVSYVSGRNH